MQRTCGVITEIQSTETMGFLFQNNCDITGLYSFLCVLGEVTLRLGNIF